MKTKSTFIAIKTLVDYSTCDRVSGFIKWKQVANMKRNYEQRIN